MKKRIFSLSFIFLLVFQVFAKSGSVMGEKNLRVAKTIWFDIIYPERCEESAKILFSNADRIYEEVTSQYDLEPQFRMPLVITPAVEQLNAFFAPAPYNHIVLYDTSFYGVDELAVFSESLLSVFRHELTHAVTMNMKNAFWSKVTGIFGDTVNLGLALVSSGMAEGATLTSESADGEGRLNDEYAKHYVKQAKIEGLFPSYYDVQGASEKSPGGMHYYFNGAFHQWLQQNYGMEKYCLFWYKTVNFQGSDVSLIFKKVYGIKLKTAWKLFEESYEVPAVTSNPVASNLVKDFFVKNGVEYSQLNDAGSLYHSLTASEKRLVWVDSQGKRVLYVDNADLNKEKIKPKKLFNLYGVYNANQSKDGALLAVTCFDDNSFERKSVVRIYNFEKKQLYTVKEKGLKNASVINADGDYYLFASKYVGPKNTVQVYKIGFNSSGRISGLEKCGEKILDLNVMELNYTDLGNGKIAFIEKNRMDYCICICDVQLNSLKVYTVPVNRMVIRSLSCIDDSLVFSWAAPGTLPRLGIFDLTEEKMCLSKTDISGGVFWPAVCGDEVIYIGEFFNQNRIFRTSFQSKEQMDVFNLMTRDNGDSPRSSLKNGTMGTALDVLDVPQNSQKLFESKKYNPFSYLNNGIFLPLSTYQTEYFGCNATYVNDISEYLLGLTYITSNPWSDFSNDLYQFTAGYSLFNSSFGIGFTMINNADTSILQTKTNLKTEFDKYGWKQSNVSFLLGSNLHFGKTSTLLLQTQAKGNIGRQDKRTNLTMLDAFNLNYYPDLLGCCSSPDNTVYYALSDIVSVIYKNTYKTGAGRYELAGIETGISFGYKYEASIKNIPVVYHNGFNMTYYAKGYIPHLLPYEDEMDFITNMPTVIDFILFPTKSTFGYTKPNTDFIGHTIFDVNAESIITGYNFQKSLPFINGIFINDLYCSFGYAGTLAAPLGLSKIGFQLPYLPYYLEKTFDGDMKYFDSIYIKIVLGMSPNIGVLASPQFKMNLYCQYTYGIHCGTGKTKNLLEIGLQTAF